MNIVFMGTPDFAKKSLEALYNSKHNIIAVVTNPDKQQGRGMKIQVSPVKEFAQEKEIKILQPDRIRKNTEFISEIKEMNPDVICVVAYGKILPKELLDIPKYGCINVHGSLLPKYRGAAPIQWAVLNGDKKTGITTMYMNEGMDTGDMIFKQEVEIGENETTGELWNRLSDIGAEMLVKTIDAISEGIAPREKQSEEGTMAPMLSKEMAKIDWNNSASKIKNLVRGLNPIMGAYTFWNEKKIKIWRAEIIELNKFVELYKDKINQKELEGLYPGTVVISNHKMGLYIKTNNDIISVKEIQGESSKKMDIKAFLIGNNIPEGTKLG